MTRIKTAGETRVTWIEICKSYTLLRLTYFMTITLNTILALSHIQINIFFDVLPLSITSCSTYRRARTKLIKNRPFEDKFEPNKALGTDMRLYAG